MPQSRRRPKRRSKPRRPTRHPYEVLISGIARDERLRHWYQRAFWSFFRGPGPNTDDLEEADSAVERAFEWFAFDLVLPDSGKTPAEDWIHREAQQQHWSATVTERYLRFTRGQYGVFEVIAAQPQDFLLKDVHSGGTARGLATANWQHAERGDFVAARLFPLESERPAGGIPETLAISPASVILPDASRAALRKIPADALAVETVLGANPEWMAAALAGGMLDWPAGEFLRVITDDGVELDELRATLADGVSPDELIATLTSELEPLTPEEPALLGSLIAVLWVDEQHRRDVPVDVVEARSRVWKARLGKSRNVEDETPTLDFDGIGEWRIRDEDLIALRTRRIDDTLEWVGRRRLVHAAVAEPGKLPVFPDVILWMERPSGLIMNVSVVAQDAPPTAMLDALADGFTRARPDGLDPVLPAVVSVPSARWAAALSSALAPLGIRARPRYVVPDINQVFRSLNAHAGMADDPDGTADAADWRYLDLPDANPVELARLHASAAAFFRAAPWRVLDDRVSIHVEFPSSIPMIGGSCDRLDAVLLGNAGQTFGLALYFDPMDLVRMRSFDNVADVPEMDTINVTFDRDRGTPPGVVSEIRAHQWEVAGRLAYPTVLRTSRRAPMRLVTGGETTIMRAALDAVHWFVARHEQTLARGNAEVSDVIEIDGVGRVVVSCDATAEDDFEN